MASTDVRLPPASGLYAGGEVFYVHPAASDAYFASVLSGMMGGSPVTLVEELAAVPDRAVAPVYVFSNGVDGLGPFGFQKNVFPDVPGEPGYRPLRRVHQVAWTSRSQPRRLDSAVAIRRAADAGQVTVEATDTVVDMPMLVWPGGQR